MSKNNTQEPLLTVHTQVEGMFKLEVIQEDGTLKQDPALNHTFKNVITNAGLNYAATFVAGYAGIFLRCGVGTGNTPPAFTDTSLNNEIGTRANPSNTITTGVMTTSPPYFVDYGRVYTFAIGAIVGNISEVGIFNGTGGTAAMWSRALIKDTGGNPVTLTLTATDQLKVTYTCRTYQATGTTGSFTLSTNGVNSTVNYTVRPANLGRSNTAYPLGVLSGGYTSSNSTFYFYETQTLGPVTGYPSGTAASFTFTAQTYVADSFERVWAGTLPPAMANFTTGIGSMTFMYGGSSSASNTAWQISFSPSIPKTSVQTLAISVKISWGRYTG